MLTDKENKDIALGYVWNSEMSYEDFVKANSNISYQDGHEMYQLINQRYITYKYGDAKD